MGRSSQIDREIVKDALEVLGFTPGGGGPDLSAEVAQLQADVADLSQRVVDVEDVVGNIDPAKQVTAWVIFDGTTAPPTLLGGLAISDVQKNAPGAFTVFLSQDMGTADYGVLFSATEPMVETGRTSSTIDLDCGGTDPERATVAVLGVPIEPA